MDARIWTRCGIIAASTVLVGGCATLPGTERFAYYQVPCETPGAIVARPLSPEESPAAGTPAPPSPTPQQAATVGTSAQNTCVVPVSLAGSGYGRRFYPGGGGYYGGRGYGSFGIGLGIGSHGGRGYGSHGISRHHGSGHPRGHGGGRRH